jgi:ParB family chromosome partitioning protein
LAALQTVINRDLTVRQTEELVRMLAGERPTRAPRPEPSPEVRDLEERLREQLGTRVTVRHGSKGGQVIIHYYSSEELDSIVNHLLSE